MSNTPARDFFRTHPKTQWSSIALSVVVLVIVLFLTFFDWNLLRPTLARHIEAATGRPTSIDGDLKVHLFSFNPRAEVNLLTIGNPPWAQRNPMFGAKRIVVSISLRHLLTGNIVLPLVELTEPDINLERDARGRASWELGTQAGTPNHNTKPAKLPTVQRLVIDGGKLHVTDLIRKLTFSGTLTAAEQNGHDDQQAFKVRCSGTLNKKPFRLEANGGPLLNLEPDKPYTFSTHLTASDIDLRTHTTVLKPFDLSVLDSKFEVSGNDLADVFYLTGLALPNTPNYRLAATLHINGNHYVADDLQGSLGSSDISGKIQVELVGDKPKLTAKLSSHKLNIVDLAPTLGQAAPKSDSLATSAPKRPLETKPARKAPSSETSGPAPADAAPANDGRLLPDANLQVDRVRGMDADVTYHAASVTAPKVPMKEVNLHVVLHGGVLTIDPLAFVLDAGRFSGKVEIDARRDIPVTTLDMRIDDVDLSQFKSASMKQAPLTGELQGRFQFHGPGASLHKFAAGSDGLMSVVIPHGQMNGTIAELTGINVLSALGVLLSSQQGQQTDLRCGIVDFKDHQGSLNTTTVYVDTSNVLITGRGHIDLDSEDISLALQGDPKKIRLLRLRSPILLHGTLSHPEVGIKTGKLAEQAGVAAVLGVLLTPAAAALAFIDPGLAKDKDCASVLDQASAGVQN